MKTPKITLGVFLIIIGIMLIAIARYYDCTNELAKNNRIREQEEYADNASILITTVSQPENNHYVDSVSNKDILIPVYSVFELSASVSSIP